MHDIADLISRVFKMKVLSSMAGRSLDFFTLTDFECLRKSHPK